MGFSDYLVRVTRTADSGTSAGTTDPDTGVWTPGAGGAGGQTVVLDWLDADVQEEGDSLRRITSGEAVLNADATIFVSGYKHGRVQTILRLMGEGDIVEVKSKADNVTRDCQLLRARALDGTLYVKFLGAAVIP